MVQENLIRLVVVQDYCLLRNTLAERINRESLIEVCGQASCNAEAYQLVSQYKPELVLINISLRSPAGFALLRRLKRNFKGMPVLTFSCDPEFEHLYAEMAMRAGADGYVSSADDEETLVQAIHNVTRGHLFLSSHLEHHHRKSSEEKMVFENLSHREIEVFCLTGCGHMPKGIAEKLSLSVKTVESYRERIREKLGLRDGAELLYSSTTFMRKASSRRRSVRVKDGRISGAVLSATSL
ncbi:MAG: response regulator transcription factor [Verrucomicrobia bacterium]|nr:response regulator transcription factor [Verrucomicrobiota bacterium]